MAERLTYVIHYRDETPGFRESFDYLKDMSESELSNFKHPRLSPKDQYYFQNSYETNTVLRLATDADKRNLTY